MKPKLFYEGQKVTPKMDGNEWPIAYNYHNKDYVGLNMPKKGEIYHVSGYQAYDDGIWGIFLFEYGRDISFAEHRFDPIDSSSDSLVNIANELIKETQPTHDNFFLFR